MSEQPVAKVLTAFDRVCIPADCVAPRSHTPGMLPQSALSGGRSPGLGARGTFTTACKRVDVLAVGAHPDDVELGCGGTLLRLKSLGRSTGVVDLTRGELGTRGTPETRAREARRAAAVLGLDFRLNLELRDGDLSLGEESRLALIRVLRQCRPKLVLTHSKWGHPDHGKATILVEEAVHHAGLAAIDTSQQRFRPRRIAFWTHFDQAVVPHVGVDISGHYEQKERALEAFASQLHRTDSNEPATYLSDPRFLERIRSFHTHVGSLVGCSLAEGFLMSRPPRIGDLTDC